jgi:hypothetical protein
MATQTAGLTDKEIRQVLERIKDLKTFMQRLEKLGAEIPKSLKTAINRFEMAIKAGKAIGEAAGEAKEALKRYEDDLYNAYKKLEKMGPEEPGFVCEARVARKFQERSVDFTLNPNNPDSTFSRLVKKIKEALQSLGSEKIYKECDYLARTCK